MSFEATVRRGRKLFKLLCTAEYRRGLRQGVAAAVEHFDLVRQLSPSLVLDVGANVGQFSLLVRGAAPAAQIIAFEPLLGPATKFSRLFEGQDNVILHRCALAPARGQAEMHVSARMDSSSLLPISIVQTAHFPGTGEVAREKVQLAPLTDFVSAGQLPPNTLLKIDVQGFELNVLRSAEPVLDDVTWIYVEASYLPFYEGQPLAGDIASYLEEVGFDALGRHNTTLGPNGEAVQADFLFLNRRHAERAGLP